MRIGIPRALLFYKYHILWETFFKELGIDIVLSPNTNKKIMDDGIKYTIDEACLSFKIYMGHVKYLIDKCDYILIPRIGKLSKIDKVCVRFNGLYDIVKNTFNDIKIIHYNIDYDLSLNERQAFIKMGVALGFNKRKVRKAYKKAYNTFIEEENTKCSEEEMKILEKKIKILIVGHPYNVNDDIIGNGVTNYLKENNIGVIYANNINYEKEEILVNDFSKELYWIDSKRLVAGLLKYKNNVDGILFLSVFPCGLDSLVNELTLRKIKDKPILNIIIDELQSEVGLKTRLESFIDIIKLNKENNHEQ